MDEPLPPAPSPWTLDYHLRFIPQVVAARIGAEQPQQSGFRSVGFGVPVVLVVCIALLGNGVVTLVDDGVSAGGVIMALLGGGGLLALIAMSASDQSEVPATWDRFEPALLAFCLVLGGTVGLFATRLVWRELAPALAWGVIFGACLCGYALGLLLGFWWQKLGEVGAAFAYLVWLAVLGMVVLGLVITSG